MLVDPLALLRQKESLEREREGEQREVLMECYRVTDHNLCENEQCLKIMGPKVPNQEAKLWYNAKVMSL
jgi:hypothetical protein